MTTAVWRDFDSEEIEGIGDERAREVMRWVHTVMEQLAAMDSRSAGEDLTSLLATACNCCDEPLGMLDHIIQVVRPRFVLQEAEAKGNG